MRTATMLVALGLFATGCGQAPAPAPHTARAHRHVVHHRSPRYVRDHDASIPILEYHVIGLHPLGSPLEGLYVTPPELRSQVGWLARHGWHAVSLQAVSRFWRHGIALPRKPIVLTFDDGYPGDWRYALPILRAKGFIGVLNLQIGNLIPLRVRELIGAGWEIDAHTFTHPDLRYLDATRLHREVGVARRWIQQTFRAPVPAFCYPAGRYNARTVSEVRAAGYLLGETGRQGWASPSQGLLTLDRIRVAPTTGTAGLDAWLRDPKPDQ